MRATRDRVRTDEVSRREIAQARIDAARTEAPQKQDRIDISIQARRRTEASQADGATRRETITRLKAAYKDGSLGIETRRRAAAERMLGSDQG